MNGGPQTASKRIVLTWTTLYLSVLRYVTSEVPAAKGRRVMQSNFSTCIQSCFTWVQTDKCQCHLFETKSLNQYIFRIISECKYLSRMCLSIYFVFSHSLLFNRTFLFKDWEIRFWKPSQLSTPPFITMLELHPRQRQLRITQQQDPHHLKTTNRKIEWNWYEDRVMEVQEKGLILKSVFRLGQTPGLYCCYITTVSGLYNKARQHIFYALKGFIYIKNEYKSL